MIEKCGNTVRIHDNSGQYPQERKVGQDRPIFIFSIDAECIWVPRMDPHYRDRLPKDERLNVGSIHKLLKILQTSDIRATWAIVGHPMVEGCWPQRCLHWKQSVDFNCRSAGPGEPCSMENLDPSHRITEMVHEILACDTPQEIGYHSFSHRPFTELSREVAEDELKKAKGLEKEWGVRFRSFVFPQNKVEHVDLLKKYGFRIFRGRTRGRYHADMGFFKRAVNGTFDKIIAPPLFPIHHDGIWEIGGSMDFCDAQAPQRVIPAARLGLARAQWSNLTFHIYLHPWNLLYLDRLDGDLRRFLSAVKKKEMRGELTIMSMSDYANYLDG